jgi:hypothetical protein
MVNDLLLNRIKYADGPSEGSMVVRVTPLLGGPDSIYNINKSLIINPSFTKFFTASNCEHFLYDESGRKYFEHLRVDGNVDYLRYDKAWDVKLNFVNIGWEGKNTRRFLRVDPYTGDGILVEEDL